ncbi:Conserved protein of unknown function [endosymbiont DhMRE of Dentiscutata heterogama]|uniref:hypothetical protein n=1 Tax=endosymbiont DhMRE of Dentiscutata heterogama TaxID=1609546 RepID=UPI000629D557|nr:hypothetical protein [endosymbiont DhMRE of Dentiscutata heterogama]CFW92779.1 Conserved protein of unknown function [endosymbiont DhMRE of Dentiscutata heterogama]
MKGEVLPKVKYLCIDPSGTGTTGIFFFSNNKPKSLFFEYQSKKWEEHLNFIVDLVKERKPEIIIYENTTYIYGRQHQGTVGLYKLIGGIMALKYIFDFIQKIDSVAVNQVKLFKNKLFSGQEQIESLTCKVGRGKGWKYKQKKISLHQLDALVVYHLWSGGSLESQKILKKKIAKLKAKKRLGIRQKEQLQKLEGFSKKN